MDTLFRWGKMHCMQKALFVLLSVVLVACSGEEKVNLPDEPETPEAEITLAEGTDKHPLLDASGGTVTLHFYIYCRLESYGWQCTCFQLDYRFSYIR